MNEDIQLYRTLLKIRESIRLCEGVSGQLDSVTKDSENESSLDTQKMNIESVTNNASYNELFKGVFPLWMDISFNEYESKKGHSEKSLMEYVNIDKFKKESNSIKYKQLCFLFLKDVVEFYKKGYKETSGQVLKKYKTERCKGVPSDTADNFWQNLDEVLRENSYIEIINKVTDNSQLRTALEKFFFIEPVKKDAEKSTSMESSSNKFLLAEKLALSHYTLYLAWMFFCTSLQTADLGNYNRLKYLLYEYFKDAEVTSGGISGKIDSVRNDFYCGEDFWDNIYLPKVKQMWKEATNRARAEYKSYISNLEGVTLNEEDELNEESIISLIKKETNGYLLYFLLTTPMKKSDKNQARVFKNNPNIATLPVVGGNSENTYLTQNPPCVMFYSPLKNVEKEFRKMKNLKTAYNKKRSKDEEHGKINI